jgi:hypothetical protein
MEPLSPVSSERNSGQKTWRVALRVRLNCRKEGPRRGNFSQQATGTCVTAGDKQGLIDRGVSAVSGF